MPPLYTAVNRLCFSAADLDRPMPVVHSEAVMHKTMQAT